MNGLTKLVKIVHNDNDTVILQVKKNKKLELIKLGCFNGDEDLIRVSKPKDICEPIDYTFFLNNGEHYGASSNTLVTNHFRKKMHMVYETINDDLGIKLTIN